MTTMSRTARRVRMLRVSVALAFALVGAFAVSTVAGATAGAASTGSATGSAACSRRSCIYDVATGELFDKERNIEIGPDNCNYYSGYWGNSGDDICGDIYGSHWRSNSWCADFARYVWSQAGANTTGLDPWAGSFYRANKTNGSYHPKESGYTPVRGDAVIYDWDGTPGLGTEGWDIDHVGLVVNYSSGTLTTIEGNTTDPVGRDGVYQKTRPTTQVVGYISPTF
jgi:CHAP domain-containing protein